MTKTYVVDIETDGLLDTVSKIHCLSYYCMDDDTSSTLYGSLSIKRFLTEPKVIVGHDFLRYDKRALGICLGIDLSKHEYIDTLALSWYLNFYRLRHGLEGYGEDYGVPKPVVTDWENLTPQEYGHRCEEDVKINTRLWRDLSAKLDRLYYKDDEGKQRLIKYLTLKMEMAAKQEELGWDLDVKGAEELREELTKLRDEKRVALSEAMPLNIVYATKNMPKVMVKQDGTKSAHAIRWYDFLKEQKLPEDTQGPVKYIIDRNPANPDSHTQIKDWLFSLGWEPITFDYKRIEGTRDERKIPQVRNASKELCSSVLELSDRDPAIHLLEGYSVLSHRISIVEGFLKHERNGKLQARVQGLTNTFRFKHVAPLVNLPGVDKPYGKEIRGLLKSPEGHVLCGADKVSLEDTTKRHYMMPFDPEYCEVMSAKGWDPHLDLAKFAGAITQETIDKGGPEVKAIRKSYKAANYSCVYGVQSVTLSRSTGLSVMKAQKLIDAYWQRNWAVEKAVQQITARKIGKETWVQNPISGFWHNLRNTKDTWSTINQSSGVYCFDTWLKYCIKEGEWPIAQFHDEGVWVLQEGTEDRTRDKLRNAINKTNEELQLNVTLDIDIQFGMSYSDIH